MTNNDGETPLQNAPEMPLHSAAHANNAVEAKRLIDSGADVNAKNNSGNAPLFYAATPSRMKMMELPTKNRVEVGAVAKLLIDNGADVNVKGFANNTPLHMAAFMCEDAEIVKLLIDNGADVNAKNDQGATPLDVAKGSAECKAMLAKNASMDVQMVEVMAKPADDIKKLLIANGAKE